MKTSIRQAIARRTRVDRQCDRATRSMSAKRELVKICSPTFCVATIESATSRHPNDESRSALAAMRRRLESTKPSSFAMWKSTSLGTRDGKLVSQFVDRKRQDPDRDQRLWVNLTGSRSLC